MYERVELNRGHGHSSLTMIGVVVSLGILAIMITFAFPMQQNFWWVVVLLAAPPCVGNHLDHRAGESSDTNHLMSLGYTRLDPDELDDDLKAAISLLHPSGTKTHHIKRCVRGVRHDTEVTLLEIKRDIGDETVRYAACAVWSPAEFAQCIIKRRGIFGQVRIDLQRNTHRLGDHHTLRTKDERAREALQGLTPWFQLKHPNGRHFRVKQPQGLKESWVIKGHWVVYANKGAPNPEAMDQLAEFTILFVHDLDRAMDMTT